MKPVPGVMQQWKQKFSFSFFQKLFHLVKTPSFKSLLKTDLQIDPPSYFSVFKGFLFVHFVSWQLLCNKTKRTMNVSAVVIQHRHTVDVEIFQSGPTWWMDRPSDQHSHLWRQVACIKYNKAITIKMQTNWKSSENANTYSQWTVNI